MLSIIIPVYNEKELLQENLPKLYKYMKTLGVPFEILICDNASTQYKTINFTHKQIKFLRIEEKGIGLGIKLGIDNAKHDILFFYAIDLPFGLDIIQESLDTMKDYDVVIGSKAHPESINNHPANRKIFSKMYNSMLNSLFHLDIKDSQGSLMFKKNNIMQYVDLLDAKNAFLETQILINAKRLNQSIVEIPVDYELQREGSKINPLKDGMEMLKELFSEKKRQKQIEKD